MPEPPFLSGYWVPGDLLRLRLYGVAGQIGELYFFGANCGDLAIVKEDHSTRVRKDWSDI